MTDFVQNLREAGLDGVDLDDLVHDSYSAKATEVNNAGMETQVAVLMGFGHRFSDHGVEPPVMDNTHRVRMVVDLAMSASAGVSAQEVLENMDYSFMSMTVGAVVYETEIVGWEAL